MAAISEKVELLGKGLYSDIPDVLTLHSIPTSSELDYVGSEDFDATMVEKILPQAIEENIDCKKLLDIDYNWICRCLRLLNYGPYFTTNAIFCGECGKTSYGEYQVNLSTIGCKPLPEGFTNDICIKADEFIDFNQDIHVKLNTIQEVLNMRKDKAFQRQDGSMKSDLAEICYSITAIGNQTTLTPLEIKMKIENEFSPADFKILLEVVNDITDYGLRAGGTCSCPKCNSKNAGFLGLVNDKFFRPTLGDLRSWKRDRSERREENLPGDKEKPVRKNN